MRIRYIQLVSSHLKIQRGFRMLLLSYFITRYRTPFALYILLFFVFFADSSGWVIVNHTPESCLSSRFIFIFIHSCIIQFSDSNKMDKNDDSLASLVLVRFQVIAFLQRILDVESTWDKLTAPHQTRDDDFQPQ